jgi:hypothetical protein
MRIRDSKISVGIVVTYIGAFLTLFLVGSRKAYSSLRSGNALYSFDSLPDQECSDKDLVKLRAR